ncbi:hypothetical protein AK812_SmicGene37595 [Symbiodinium microadriaticum]|uniref:Uncharacterized protein n=1 Tax=Symbiodinium microadriaticum TaxID=2951 RepID=A0A1Q9CFW2_SYMMI|nr:hypothetical protein AK812_SmicGene37595 [Symbiodinium microadriaticum]
MNGSWRSLAKSEGGEREGEEGRHVELSLFDMPSVPPSEQMERHTCMSKMGYNGDAAALFKSLDADRSGELSLEAFCVQNFEDPEDMVRRLGKKAFVDTGPSELLRWVSYYEVNGHGILTLLRSNNVGAEHRFTDNVRALGWSSGYEDMLFPAMNVHDKDAISVEDLKWLEMEQRRQKRKELAKKKALQENHTRNKDANFKGREALGEATFKDGSGTAWLLWCDVALPGTTGDSSTWKASSVTICGLDGETLGTYEINAGTVADFCTKLAKDITVPDGCFLELSYKEKKLDPELSLEGQGVGDGATLTLLKTKGRSVVGCRTFNMKDYPEDRYCEWEEIEFKEVVTRIFE